MRLIRLGVVIASLLAVPSAADAQAGGAPRAQRALWATVSVGRGDLQVNCGICRSVDQSSWTADLSIGGWIRPRTALGGEIGAWRLGGDEATQRVMLVGVVSRLYPLAKAAAFVKLGAGFMGYNSTDEEQSLSARSLAVQAGFGYDIPVRQYIVVPHIGLVQGFSSGLHLDGTQVTSGSHLKLIRFGVGVGVGR